MVPRYGCKRRMITEVKEKEKTNKWKTATEVTNKWRKK